MTTSQMVRVRGALRSSLPAFCSPVGITSPTHTGACGQAGASPGLSAIHSQVAHRATSQPGDGVGGGDISRVHGPLLFHGVEKGMHIRCGLITECVLKLRNDSYCSEVFGAGLLSEEVREVPSMMEE